MPEGGTKVIQSLRGTPPSRGGHLGGRRKQVGIAKEQRQAHSGQHQGNRGLGSTTKNWIQPTA